MKTGTSYFGNLFPTCQQVLAISKQRSLPPFVFFWGDSSHTPFLDWQSFQGNTLYPLAIIHMEHINVLDFEDKSERNLCFSFGNLGIIFKSASAQLFPPGRNGNSAGSEVTRRPMAAEINRCRLQVLGHACHIWYLLWLKSLTHSHSTRAGPLKIHGVMTGVFGRKWKGCASVQKHWGFFKWT